MRWLVAEDEADIRNLVEMVCRAWGYDVMTFEDGGQVWDWLDHLESGSYTETLPEFVLMDIRMPGKKGDEIARRMRTIPALQHLPIVLMTAFSLDETQRRLLHEQGVDQIINKPLPDFDRLYTVLHEVLRNKSL